MRLLILTQYFPPEIGAAQTRLAAVANELKRQKHTVEVVTAVPNYPTGRIFPKYRGRLVVSEEWEGFVVHRTWMYASRGAGIKRILSYASFLASSFLGLYKARKPDCIFVESPPLTLALGALLASRIWRVPVIVNVADLWPDSLQQLGLWSNKFLLGFLSKLESFVYKNATFVNAVTEGIRATLIDVKGISAAKVTFLPNGVDTVAYHYLPPDTLLKDQLGLTGKSVVLYAGTHGFAHGLEHVLHAARDFEREDVHFLMIGDGSEKDRLVGLARELQLRNVTFLHPIRPDEIPRYLSIAECGLVSQRKIKLFEGNRPAKTFSIMACAKAVVFVGEGEGARLVTDAQAGLVVPPEDPQALTASIRKLLANQQTAMRFGENGRAFVEECLTWKKLVCNWLAQLRSLGAPGF